jgi:hypothetical protein
MTDFFVAITDPAQLQGITWAREQYNAALPPPTDPPDPEAVPPIETDQDYMNWVMTQAAVSYAQQKVDADWREAYDAAKAADAPPPTQQGAPPHPISTTAIEGGRNAQDV